MENKIATIMNVNNNEVKVIMVGNEEYISLANLARYKNKYNPGDVIIKWMSNKSSFDFYCLWEELFNENFKLAESREFKNDSSTQSFTMSPFRRISMTNAKGMISKREKYNSGTFAHSHIALEFASRIDPGFKLYLIKEFKRLKHKESKEQKIEWSVRRCLSKTNYRIHTDSIKENLIPKLSNKQKEFVYAKKTDILNIALFRMTTKEWKNRNPNLNGNIRDYADILHLIILSNLEALNANMIKNNIIQKERLEKLNMIARKELEILIDNKNILRIQKLDNDLHKTSLIN